VGAFSPRQKFSGFITRATQIRRHADVPMRLCHSFISTAVTSDLCF